MMRNVYYKQVIFHDLSVVMETICIDYSSVLVGEHGAGGVVPLPAAQEVHVFKPVTTNNGSVDLKQLGLGEHVPSDTPFDWWREFTAAPISSNIDIGIVTSEGPVDTAASR